MNPIGFFLIVGVLFSMALYAAGYYVWSVPEQEAEERLSSRLRELRAHRAAAARSRRSCCAERTADRSLFWVTW